MNNWRNDLNKSRDLFINLVWPKINIWFDLNSELIQVEEIKDSYAELLDREAGIDYLIKDKIGIRPISARVQPDLGYKTLTLREKRSSGVETEFGKLVNRINSNYLHPWMHIQAYYLNELIRVYAVKTSDLVNIIKFEDKAVWYRQTNKQDGNIFLVFIVSGLENCGIHVLKI